MTYRIDLSPEKQRLVEREAAQRGLAVEALIEAAVDTLIQGATDSRPATETKEARDAAQRARVQAARGRYSHLRETVDDFMRERHAEALAEMNKDSA